MGDRANVVIKSGENDGGDIVLYTHWAGYRVEEIVAAGIAHTIVTGRNTDTSYGQRIIVEKFFAECGSYEAGTSAGIYTGKAFESHVVVVNFNTQAVTFDPDGGAPETLPFVEFVVKFPCKTEAGV